MRVWKSLAQRGTIDRARRFVVSEYLVLLSVGIASALVFAFIELAGEVIEGETQDIDEMVVNWFRVADNPEQLIGPIWLQEAVRDVTALGSGTVLTMIVIIVATGLMLVREWRGAVLIVVSTIGGAFLSNGLKSVFARDRPDLATIHETLTASFPSGHALLSAVTFLTLGALLARIVDTWRLKIFFFVIAVLLTMMVGVSRVYLGVHYPSDVLAGWALGFAWAMAWSAIAFFLQRRGII